ncbi:hypothetical protein [Maribellus mangrovi]|uniref:hypothetical protein n=1 Tax=Maribellus mangrovi TaxID=3133146 RepID=UPI0030EC311C
MADQAFAGYLMNWLSENNDMGRAYSVANVLDAKFNRLELEGKWRDAIGCPELTGTWFVQGDIKNGKSSLTFQMTKYLTRFERVGYNFVEEGLSATVQDLYHRENMREVAGRFILIDKESPEELYERLKKHKSPNIVVIDTIQFWEFKFSDYKQFKHEFNKKLFIYVSHMEGKKPAGAVAQKIWRDANVAFVVEGFKGFPTSRYGGGEPVIINQELADAYWGLG